MNEEVKWRKKNNNRNSPSPRTREINTRKDDGGFQRPVMKRVTSVMRMSLDDPREDFSKLSLDEVINWSVDEIEDYNLLLSLRKRINKAIKRCTSDLFSIFEFKEKFLKQIFKPCSVDAMNDFIILCSNLYLSFTVLDDTVKHGNRILFIRNDSENYNFIPFKLLMKQYVELERVIETYEEKLSFSLNQIGKLTPELENNMKLNKTLETNHENLLKINNNLETKISNLRKRLSEKYVTKGKDMIKEFKENQIQSKKKMKKISRMVENEISGMGVRLEQFENVIGSIIIHPDNHVSERTQSKLYSMQIHIMHLVRKFQTVHQTVEQLQEKLKKMMEQKISGTKNEVRSIQERKGYNLKMKFARRNLSSIEKNVLPDLKLIGDMLNKEIVKKEDKKKSFELLNKNISEISRIQKLVQQILIPMNPKKSMASQLEVLQKSQGEVIHPKEEKKKKFRKKKRKKKRKVLSVEKDFISRQEHSKILSQFCKKIKKMENHYEKKIRDIKRRMKKLKSSMPKKKRRVKSSHSTSSHKSSRSGEGLKASESMASLRKAEEDFDDDLEVNTVPIKNYVFYDDRDEEEIDASLKTFLKETDEDRKRRQMGPENKDVIDFDKDDWMEKMQEEIGGGILKNEDDDTKSVDEEGDDDDLFDEDSFLYSESHTDVNKLLEETGELDFLDSDDDDSDDN